MERLREVLLLAALIALPACALAQWSPPVQVSSSTSPARLRYNFGWAIGVDGAGVVHTTWLEEASPEPMGHGTGRVMYSRSPDDGRAWTSPVALSGPPQPVTGHPRLAASGPHVYVAWHGLHDGSGIPKIYLLHSGDHGGSWDPPRLLSDHTAETGGGAYPSVNACGDAVHVVWADQRTGVAEIYLRSSPDGAASWTPVRAVSTSDGRSSWVPSVACQGTTVHVAWADERHNVDDAGEPYDCGLAHESGKCREEEYYRRSSDFGETWEPEVRLTHDAGEPHPSWAPSIAVWGNLVHVAFFDSRNGQFEIYYQRSAEGGAAHSWEPERPIGARGGSHDTMHARPSIAALGSSVHVAWFAITPARGVDVFQASSRDAGLSFPPARPLTSGPVKAEAHPSVAVSPHGSAHVIWYEPRDFGVDQVVHRALRPRRPGAATPWD